MAQDFQRRIRVFQTNTTTDPMFTMDADLKRLEIGNTTGSGSLTFAHANNATPNLELDGNSGTLSSPGAMLDGLSGSLTLGAESRPGKVDVTDGGQNTTIFLDGDIGQARLGGVGQDGTLRMRDMSGDDTVKVDARDATIEIGAKGHKPRLTMQNSQEMQTLEINGEDASLSIGNVTAAGSVKVRDAGGQTTIDLDSDFGAATLGGRRKPGRLRIRGEGEETISFEGQSARVDIGPLRSFGKLDGPNGKLFMHSPGGGTALTAGVGKIANFRLKKNRPELFSWDTGSGLSVGEDTLVSTFSVWNEQRGRTLLTYARSILPDEAKEIVNFKPKRDLPGFTHFGGIVSVDGVFSTTNSYQDIAESFPLSEEAAAEPGSVMVIGPEGDLIDCVEEMDRRAVGVVSGAGDLAPGLVLGGALIVPDDVFVLDDDPMVPEVEESDEPEVRSAPVAVAGTVFCKVDAGFGPIEPGDLLTTSSTPGHAMKVHHPAEGIGAIIGKALEPMEGGQGLIKILVMQA